MAEELRHAYSPQFIDTLSQLVTKELPSFDLPSFRSSVFQNDWEHLTLKERMRRVTTSLYATLPTEYEKALAILYKVAPKVSQGLPGLVFPDFVQVYGLAHWEKSMQALAFFTKLSSAEFAVRPFLLEDNERMMKQMIEWSKSDNEHVRRLASEGSRPRLPWGLTVPSLKSNPRQTFAILNQLKQDESLYVRKSVANHLNDVSYLDADFVLDIAYDWYGNHPETNWIVKHACRSLLKKGNERALTLFGYGDPTGITIDHVSLDKSELAIGDDLLVSFTVHSSHHQPVRIEYVIDFVKATGSRSAKSFILKQFEMKENETREFQKRHSFKDLTTRKHYKGLHTLSLKVNGVTISSHDFFLT